MKIEITVEQAKIIKTLTANEAARLFKAKEKKNAELCNAIAHKAIVAIGAFEQSEARAKEKHGE